MSVNDSLSAAQRAWRMLWDRGKTSDATREGSTGTTKSKTRRKKKNQQRTTKNQLLQQTTINGDNQDSDDVESFGDQQQAKRDNILRVGFQNIHNLPEDGRTSKSRQLVDYVVQKGFDCFLMAEIGLNWRKNSGQQ